MGLEREKEKRKRREERMNERSFSEEGVMRFKEKSQLHTNKTPCPKASLSQPMRNTAGLSVSHSNPSATVGHDAESETVLWHSG